MKSVGKQSIDFDNVYLASGSTAVGPLEGDGPLGQEFDKVFDDLYCGETSWEKAEQNLMKTAINSAIKKANINESDISFAFAGDLLNQTVTSNYVMRDFKTPFFGIYGACSTSMESLILASVFVDSKLGENVLIATSSHNGSAEKTYRYPTEYGGQKPQSATFTVTGAASAIISQKTSEIRITKATVGRVIDAGENNPNDMGSAMAPAAYETIKQHLIDFNTTPDEYDGIFTGDLSSIGSAVLKDLMKADGILLDKNYNDCGLLIYDLKKQPVFSGGSGCACAATVTFSHLKNKLLSGEYKKILVCATGALLNPIIVMQKESIPSIAHAVVLERV